ncbi:universal stress protein [Streptomyces sp. WM6372]|uniref:universal stress protein n=1 Tax=Streptomyces sp. WM6372 TaxID=1415555 RepID=UPI000AEDD029|nr:universal stress protein [Streptomyces sp. WM6372]
MESAFRTPGTSSVVVGVDGSQPARSAARYTTREAEPHKASLRLPHVWNFGSRS